MRSITFIPIVSSTGISNRKSNVHSPISVVRRTTRSFSSILMDSTMNVKITDLGFAVQVADNESLYDLFGTPGT